MTRDSDDWAVRTLSLFALCALAACGSMPAIASARPSLAPTTTEGSVAIDRSCETSSVSTLDFEDCATHELGELNPHISALIAQLKAMRPGHEPEIDAAQMAWQAYVKAQCGLAAVAVEGGSKGNIDAGACLVADTESRVAELRAEVAYFANPGGYDGAPKTPYPTPAG